MHETFGYWDYGGPATELGFLGPNGTLVAHVDTGEDWANYWHVFRLDNVPWNCIVYDPHPYPAPGFTIPATGVLNVEFEVECPPSGARNSETDLTPSGWSSIPRAPSKVRARWEGT